MTTLASTENINLSSLTVPKLKEICRRLGLTVGGKKAELVARIEAKQGAMNPTIGDGNIAKGSGFKIDENGLGTREESQQQDLVGRSTRGNLQKKAPTGKVNVTDQRKRKVPEVQTWVSDGAELKKSRIGPESRVGEVGQKALEVVGERSVRELELRDNFAAECSSLGEARSRVGGHDIGRLMDESDLHEPGTTTLPSGLISNPQAPQSSKQLRGLVTNGTTTDITKIPGVMSVAKKPDTSSQVTGTSTEMTVLTTEKVISCSKINPSKGYERRVAPSSSVLSTQRDGKITRTSRPLALSEKGKSIVDNSDGLFESGPVVSGKVGLDKNKYFIPRKKVVLSIRPKPVSDDCNISEDTPVEAIIQAPDSRDDMSVKWKPIRFPPKIGIRRRIEAIGRVLALVAFNSSTVMQPAGQLLKRTIHLSKAYHYATVLAFFHLCNIHEFSGKRTAQWMKVKKVDSMIADCREWYWHRIKQRCAKIQQIKEKWFGERLWTEYIYANGLEEKYQKNHMEFGLWCSGIDLKLLNENRALGQWDVAARFWAGRFCAAMFSGRLDETFSVEESLGMADPISDAFPIGQNGLAPDVSAGGRISEVWEVITRKGGIYFIVGGTGEVIGTLRESMNMVMKHQKLAPRSGTVTSTTPRFTKWHSQRSGHASQKAVADGLDEVSWKSLRIDWRNYVSKLIAFSDQAEGERSATSRLISSTQYDSTPVEPIPLLLSQVYHPSPKQFNNAIHESIREPRHRIIAERFILAHSEEYGFSGGKGNPISGGKRVGLDVDCKWRVESVACSGETIRGAGWHGGQRGRLLGNGLAFVQTGEGGWFVLEETGEIIAQEDYGICGVWGTILGVDERGVTLEGHDLERLRMLFHVGHV